MARFLVLTSILLLVSSTGTGQTRLKYVYVKPFEGYEMRYQADSANPAIPHGEFRLKINGRIVAKGFYNQGKRHGKWERFYLKGQKMIEGSFLNDRKHGEWTYHHANGQLRTKAEFRMDQPNGQWVSFDAAGNKAAERLYEEGGIKQAIAYYPSGNVAYNIEYEVRDSVNYRSESFYFDDNARLYKYQEFKEGKLDGLYRTYHAKGNVWEELEYEEGKLIFVRQMATWNGQPMPTGTLADGNGELRRYYPDGIIFSKVNYKNGLPNDSATYYEENGFVRARGTYRDGKLTGTWEFRTKFNQVDYFIQTYDDRPGYRFVDGHKLDWGERIELDVGPQDMAHGKWRSYNDYNNVTEERGYAFGLRHGETIEYHQITGKPRAREPYTYGSKTGTWRYFRGGGRQVFSDDYVAPPMDVDSNWMLLPEHPEYLSSRQNFSLEPYRGEAGLYIEEDGARPYLVWRSEFINLVTAKRFMPPVPGSSMLTGTFAREVIANEHPVPREKSNFTYQPLLTFAFIKEPMSESKFLEEHFKVPDFSNNESGELGSLHIYRIAIDEFGFLDELVFLKPGGMGLDEKLEDLYRRMPLWEPAMFNHMPMDCVLIKGIYF